MPKDRGLKVIYFISIVIAILIPAINIYYIYPKFTDLLIGYTEEEAERAASYLQHVLIPPDSDALSLTLEESEGRRPVEQESHVSSSPISNRMKMENISDASTTLVYTIQVASFKDLEQAQGQYESLKKSLDKESLAYMRIEKIGQYYTVRIGKFSDEVSAAGLHHTVRAYSPSSVMMESYIKRERIKAIYSLDRADGEETRNARSSSQPKSETSVSPTLRTQDFSDKIRDMQRNFKFIKLKIFSETGEIIHSTDSNDIGKVNTKDYFHSVVALGKKYSKVVKKNRKTLEDQIISADVVETYVPILAGDKFIGAFEIYYDITQRMQDLNNIVLILSPIPLVILICYLFMVMVGIFRLDKSIIARKNAEKGLKIFARQLEDKNRELEDFSHTASHDLQEPLRKIISFGERLKLKCADSFNDQGRDYLNRMQKAAERMQNLINGLLMFSRVNTKAQPFEPVDLGQVTKDVLSDLEVRIQETGGHVEMGDLDIVDADPLQMRQLLQNLISNALKFHKENEPPLVKVSGSVVLDNGNRSSGRTADNEYYRMIIEDNGIGFDEKYADRIFGAFQRLHGKNEYEGTGIGLSVCRKIAERHGGYIEARSAPGSGAQFIVTLPVRHYDGNGSTGTGDREQGSGVRGQI